MDSPPFSPGGSPPAGTNGIVYSASTPGAESPVAKAKEALEEAVESDKTPPSSPEKDEGKDNRKRIIVIDNPPHSSNQKRYNISVCQ